MNRDLLLFISEECLRTNLLEYSSWEQQII